ncbi:MAG: thioether cross-link-forming SCIFF peptide maturase [Oscillospiraceae bacterium]|jgi:uncharacterized protein|nr:thioether cross-link-forming SCIFF peptide maturase [Oscillospiraceae bacterium]
MIHKFKMQDANIVVDVGSGSVYEIDEIVYELLECHERGMLDFESDASSLFRFYQKYGEENVESALSEVRALISEGRLFSKEPDLTRICEKLESPIKAMCLNIAHDCNLVCKYCFASWGAFGGECSLMDEKTTKSAIDFLIKNSGSRRNLEVDFFGGEPLINFGIIEKTVEYAKKESIKHGKLFRFTITTNGLALDEKKIDFINREMSNVILSLDGRKSVHDAMRFTKTGAGSFDIVVPKFKRLVEKRGGKNYFVRGTFTRNNLDFTKDFMEIYNLGFDRISLEPVISKDLEYAITELDADQICSEYEKLTETIIALRKRGSKIDFFHFMVSINGGPCAIKRVKGCGCANEYVAITPEGDVYPCHQFVGISEFKMGNIKEKFDKSSSIKLHNFGNPSIFTNPECGGCWAKFYCGGLCRANNWNFNNYLDSPHKLSCKLEKKRLECAFRLSASISI